MMACTAAAARPVVARRMVTRASAASAGTEQRTLKALNITRSTLIDSNGGRAVRIMHRLRALPPQASFQSGRAACCLCRGLPASLLS